MKHGLFCLIVLGAVAPLYGQQIGDTVIVVAPIEAKLKMEAREAGAGSARGGTGSQGSRQERISGSLQRRKRLDRQAGRSVLRRGRSLLH